MSKEKIIFVDYNGVISYKNFWHSIESDSHYLNKYQQFIDEFLFQKNIDVVKDWMIGNYDSEEIHRLICENIPLDYDSLFEVFVDDAKQMDSADEIFNAIQDLPDSYLKVLRTDNMDSFTRFTVPANQRFNEVFDIIDNSYELHSLKTDNGGKYFRDRANQYQVDIQDCILIDDSLKNCKVFRNLGGTAMQVTGIDRVVSTIQSIKSETAIHSN